MNDELNRELAGTQPTPGIPGARITGPANVAGATSGDTDAYRARIAAKIKGNVILPMDVTGNPTAEFDVTQLPSGEVIDVRLRKSSGNRTLDEAWERAIRKSSPLPKPDQPDAFRRELTLRFRPND
jgi:colicin import membrane protein